MKTTLQKKIALQHNKKDNSKQYRFFEAAVYMCNSRARGKDAVPIEYCTGMSLSDIYDLFKSERPHYLLYNGKELTRKEFIQIIEDFTVTLKDILINGTPIMMPGGIGAVGVEIYKKKIQLPSSRYLPDKEKKYTHVPRYRLQHTKKHLYKKASDLINIDKHSIHFTKIQNFKIISRYLNDNYVYALTGPNMHNYARIINHGISQ